MLDTKFWKNYFIVYDYLNNLIPYKDLLISIVNELRISSTDVVFDAGSGTGNLSIKLNNLGVKVYSMDYSLEGINLHVNKHPGANVMHGDLTVSLPFNDNFFDKICSNNVIYTLPNSKRAEVFKEFYRILKPGGLIVVSNLLVNFNPINIYTNHVYNLIKTKGVIYTIKSVLKLFVPTIKIFYFNYLIKKEHDVGSYLFMNHDDQKKLLRDAGFINISDNMIVYAGQAIMNSANK